MAPPVIDPISPGSPLFFSETKTSQRTSRLVRSGRARQLGARLYSVDLETPPEELIRRDLWAVVAGYAPGGVISDRTGFELGIVDGSLTLVVERNANDVQLPGLRIRKRLGPGPLAGDQPFMSELFVASRARLFLDNLRPSRSRDGYRRTLTREQIEQELVKVLRRQDESGLNALRDEGRALAAELDAEAEFEQLDGLISALLTTGPDVTTTFVGRAFARSQAYDPDRNLLFDELLAAVIRYGARERPDTVDDIRSFAFWEAYFSNYIEGTVFPVDEAERIVFEGYEPPQRPKDARDVLGTFVLAVERSRADVPQNADEFIEMLRREHARMLASRPEIAPGEFKTDPNQAGNTSFVDPRLVEGTLRQGFERIRGAPPGFPRAVVTMFVVSEVHPFVDGNGRMARLRMNAELTAAGQQRILIPTAFQQDYLGALRRLSRAGDAETLVRALDRAQEYSVEVPFPANTRATEAVLQATNAFDPDRVLRLPRELAPERAPARSLSSAARLAQAALRIDPDENTPQAIANGPLGVDQLDVEDIREGLRELADARLAEVDAEDRWRLTTA
jgi:hypothetical protein